MFGQGFHFEQPLWLLGILLCGVVWAGFRWLPIWKSTHIRKLDDFIDPHLQKHLLIDVDVKPPTHGKYTLIGIGLWCLLSLALAGPQWDYTEVETFAPDQSLVILLDVSKSMDARDLQPSRLQVARQEIQDIVTLSKSVNIGLVAFAADPHMINPLTDDKEAIIHLLPSISTDLVFVQGSQLSSALRMARTMLDVENGHNKSVLILSDGGIEDEMQTKKMASDMAQASIKIYSMGIGTKEGAPIRNSKGQFIQENAEQVISHLDQATLSSISKAGQGAYITQHYSDQDAQELLQQVYQRANADVKDGEKTKQWEPRFYVFVFLMMVLLLGWFRKNFSLLSVALLIITATSNGQAKSFADYFYNSAQQGQKKLQEEQYDQALELLRDPYRQGVALYKAGKFKEAEAAFEQSTRHQVEKNARFNQANAQAFQGKIKQAIGTLENLLQDYPQDQATKDNLKILRSMDQEQDSKDEQSKGSSQNKDMQEQDKTNQDQSSTDLQEQQPDSDQAPRHEDSGDPNQELADSPQNPEDEKKDISSQQSREDRDKMPEEEGDKVPTSAMQEQADVDADLWLNKIVNNPEELLKNQFYIESKRNKTKNKGHQW